MIESMARYLRHGPNPAVRIDAEPQHGQDGSSKDREIPKIVSEAGSNSYGKWNRVVCTLIAIEDCKEKKEFSHSPIRQAVRAYPWQSH